MQPLVSCPSCGANIGAVLSLFYLLKLAAINDHRDRGLPMRQGIDYGAIVRELGYDKPCCFNNITSNRLIHDFGISMSSVLSSDGSPYIDADSRS